MSPAGAEGWQFCHHKGFLVGAGYPIANEKDLPFSEEELARDEIRGCGNLICSSCGHPVKRWDERRFKERTTAVWLELPPAEELTRQRLLVEGAYDAADAEPHLVPDPKRRAYSCRCLRFDLKSWEDLYETNITNHWNCAGHQPG